jgi:hypothetical protein
VKKNITLLYGILKISSSNIKKPEKPSLKKILKCRIHNKNEDKE